MVRVIRVALVHGARIKIVRQGPCPNSRGVFTLAISNIPNMPEVGNYTVRIQNEETQEFFEEHQTKTTGDKTECYIVSKTGEKFSISCNLSDDTQSSFPKIAFLFEIHVDGHRVEECLDGKLGRNYLKTGQVRGISVARDREAPFLFGLTCFTGKS